MKKTLICMGFAMIAAIASTAWAQVEHEIALTRAEIQTERQAIVAENLPLTEEQAKAFWALFREYRQEMAGLGDRYVTLIEDYAKNYLTLTDEQAKKLLDEMLSIQKDETKIKSDWVSKFGKVLPMTAVARFYQIENKLDAVVRLELAGEIPLVPHKPATQQAK
jgi:hypothetical protein